MSSTGRKLLLKVQRESALKVASLHSMAFFEAVQILAILPPINLLTLERQELYEHSSQPDVFLEFRVRAKANLMLRWQERWDIATGGRWIHRLLSNVSQWHGRTHREISFHLFQAFSGYGCFAAYLHRFEKLDSLER